MITGYILYLLSLSSDADGVSGQVSSLLNTKRLHLITWTLHKENSMWGKANGNSVLEKSASAALWFVLLEPDTKLWSHYTVSSL